MIISSVDEKLLFSSWDEIQEESVQKKIQCPEVSQKQFLDSINEIKSVCPSSFFKNPTVENLKSLLNQIKYYTNDGKHFAFVHDLYDIACLIKEAKSIPNVSKLFKAGIFSNFGFFTQFQVTVWLNRYVPVLDMELSNSPFYTDILVKLMNRDIHFHVKDIREEERRMRVEHAVITIESILTAKARERRADKILAVSKFDGVPPASLSLNYWENFASTLDEKPQKLSLTFPSSSSSANKEDITIELEFEWRPWSGTYVSPTASFNNSMRLIQEYEKLLEKTKKNSPQNGEIHILVAITEDQYEWNDIIKQIEGDLVGLVVLEIFDNEFTRSPFMLPLREQTIQIALNKNIPEYIDLLP